MTSQPDNTGLSPKLKSDFLHALRDPNNKQTRGRLIDVDGSTCAAGLLIKLATNEERVWNIRTVSEAAKATSTTQSFMRDLAALNDCVMLTFPEIADWIENGSARAGRSKS